MLAYAYQHQGRYDLSEQTLLQAQEAVQKRESPKQQIAVNIALSDLYLATQRLDDADRLGFQAIETAYSLDRSEAIAAALHNWGNISLAFGDYEEAAFAYQESLSLYQENKNLEGSLRVLINSIDLALAKSELQQAQALLQQGLNQTQSIYDAYAGAEYLLALAERTKQLSRYKNLTQED